MATRSRDFFNKKSLGAELSAMVKEVSSRASFLSARSSQKLPAIVGSFQTRAAHPGGIKDAFAVHLSALDFLRRNLQYRNLALELST